MSFFQAFMREILGVPAPAPSPSPVHRVPLSSPARSPARQHTSTAPKIRCADMLAVGIFAERAKPLSPFASAYDSKLVGAVESLPDSMNGIGGGTNLTAGLRMANNLLANAPRGLLRRAWLLTDGQDNVDSGLLFDEVERSRQLHININTIGFGNPANFDENRLREIARRTHNGKYVPVVTAQALGQVLRGKSPRPTAAHRGEATVYVIDGSGSMLDTMGSCRKIDVVRDTLRELIIYKQRMFS